MKNLIKSIAILALIIAVTSPMLVGFLTYKFQVKKIKKQVKQELIANTAKTDLVSFEFDIKSETFQNLSWKHSREFELDKKMFDIVEADTIGNTIYYLCFPDKQETELNAKFSALLKARYDNDEPLNNNQNLLANFIKSLYVEDLVSFEFINEEILKSQYNLYHCFYNSRAKEIISPPPQFV